MRYISLDTLKKLTSDEFMKTCCLCGDIPVQFHHNMIYAGSQSDEPETILPLCRQCHAEEKRKDIKEKLDWIMCHRMTPEQLKKFSKVINWTERKRLLVEKYGHYIAGRASLN